MFKTQISHDGHKNAVIMFKGILDEQPHNAENVILFENLAHSPKRARIDSTTYSIEGKTSIYLWWVTADDKPEFIMPMEGRGFLNFEGLQSLNAPEGAIGIRASFNQAEGKAFMVMLDLVKQ
jgi:hypothetical protein